MTQERNRAATVLEQRGDRLNVRHEGERLELPMVGFPPGFRLGEGDRVIVVDEPSGPVARPLVRSLVAELPPDAIAAGERLTIAGRRLEIQGKTVVSPPPRVTREPSSEHVLWVVESEEREAPGRVIAVRPR